MEVNAVDKCKLMREISAVEFAECYGPLNYKEGSGLKWVKNPWPWEYIKECDC